MKRLTILFLLFNSMLFSQEKFSAIEDGYPFSGSVKALPFLNLFQVSYGSWLGYEQGIYNHSIGVKFLYDYGMLYREGRQGEPPKVDITEDIDKNWLFEYRFYLDSEFSRDTGTHPFISLTYKKGNKVINEDRAYKHDFYHQETNSTYFGPGVGASLIDDSGFGLEFQFNYFFGKKNVTTEPLVTNTLFINEVIPHNYFRFEILAIYAFDF